MKGQPIRFIDGHNTRGQGSPFWRGGVSGYKGTAPRFRRIGIHKEHRKIAARALGKPLPPQAVVHHFDGDKSHDAPRNLVICEDQSYHMLLHIRQKALAASGHADWRWCRYCRQWDRPERIAIGSRGSSRHLRGFCSRSYAK